MRLLLRLLRKIKLLERVNLLLDYPYGNRLTVPIVKATGYDHFFQVEPWLSHLFGKLLSESSFEGCFIDVGVNIGQTLLKVKSIDRGLVYYGFEPNPNCLFYLNELSNVNRFSDVVIFPFALSNYSGVTELEFCNERTTDCSASLIKGFRKPGWHKLKVPVISADLIPELEATKIGIVKIDVEGGELEVLQTLSSLIRRDRPLVICEVLPIYEEANSFRLKRQNDIESLLSLSRYKIAQIHLSGRVEVINSTGIHNDISRVNYLFFPEETQINFLNIE